MKLRFAPSPTGFLHVGNARLAIANALYARRHGGCFQLRIDDTDTDRSREEFVKAIQEDIRWMGITWDETFRQTERLNRYARAIESLKASGRLYPCFESPEELAKKRELQIRQRRLPVYDRAMLKMTEEQRARAEANGKVPYWRFKLSDTTIHWHDMLMGDCHVKLPLVSDPVLVRADGTILYALASVVDDLETGITHIIRGEDHVTNTGIQLDIAQALGAQSSPFSFAHIPLLLDTDGSKFSKRFDSYALRKLRDDGIEAKALVSYLARLGSSDDPVLLPFEQQADHYELSHISRSAARFDMQQLLSLNHKLLAQLPYEAVANRLPKGATKEFWLAIRNNLDLLSEARLWYTIITQDILLPVQEGEESFLQEAAALLPQEPWDTTTWKTWITALREQTGRHGKSLFHPIRLALTGEEQGPELRDLLPLIGRKRTLARLIPTPS